MAFLVPPAAAGITLACCYVGWHTIGGPIGWSVGGLVGGALSVWLALWIARRY
jgi:hypothetical protein